MCWPQIRRLLDAHPKVESTSARTRFIRFSGSSLDLEIFAYVLETDQAAFLAIQEELLLGIMDIMASMIPHASRLRLLKIAV